LHPCKSAIEAHLKNRLGTLFAEPFDILLYDLTSTYFEGLAEGNPAAKRGYSRDHRPDCAQIVIGLVVTKSGLPLGYEVFDGNRNDATTLEGMMAKMEALYGKASRIWVFDRGVASEKNLETLRAHGGAYLVGTPRVMLRKVETALLDGNWQVVREGIEVKVVPAPDGTNDTFILCRSADRREKEAAMHDRFERKMEDGLGRLAAAIAAGRLRSRDTLWQRIGRLKAECSRVARAYDITVEGEGESLSLAWRKSVAKAAYLRNSEGAYLLRTNLTGESEQELWHMYMQLNDAEAAFRTLKQDLSMRPVYHQIQQRVQAHVLVCFIAHAMYRTLDRLARDGGLDMTARRRALVGLVPLRRRPLRCRTGSRKPGHRRRGVPVACPNEAGIARQSPCCRGCDSVRREHREQPAGGADRQKRALGIAFPHWDGPGRARRCRCRLADQSLRLTRNHARDRARTT
jgi:transposase